MTKQVVARRIKRAMSALTGVGPNDGASFSSSINIHGNLEAVAFVAGLGDASCNVENRDGGYLVAEATVDGVSVTAFGPHGITELPAATVASGTPSNDG